MEKKNDNDGYLVGQMLIAMPHMRDPRFSRAVVFICAHSEEGAMGLVVNRFIDSLTFPELLGQLDIIPSVDCRSVMVHFGGPVETGRGFVLHSTDYVQDASLLIGDDVGLTATVDVIKSIAEGMGPKRVFLALGYAGWAAGQLDEELRENAWLSVPTDPDVLFSDNLETKWERAIAKIGVDHSKLSTMAGHA